MELPTDYKKELEYKKVVGSDELTARAEIEGNITEIDGGILEYVRERMGCKRVTPEVRRQTTLFQAEIERMSGW